MLSCTARQEGQQDQRRDPGISGETRHRRRQRGEKDLSLSTSSFTPNLHARAPVTTDFSLASGSCKFVTILLWQVIPLHEALSRAQENDMELVEVILLCCLTAAAAAAAGPGVSGNSFLPCLWDL